MFKNKHIYIILFFILLFAWASCNKKNQTTPKPRGFFRIDLPEKKYQQLNIDCPYTFEYPEYSRIIQDPGHNGNPCFVDVNTPKFKGNIHLSYKNIKGSVKSYIEDSRELAYKHTVKAEAIKEEIYSAPNREVYGVLYKLKGNVASPMQFFMTDSTRHFLRGSLYFRMEPSKDSLAPVIDFIEKDIRHLIETLQWKNK
jgi:gliding motility-associated lipoprotein GldD